MYLSAREISYFTNILIQGNNMSMDFEQFGAFFAFSNKQYEEKAELDITYVQLVHGLICPKENADACLDYMQNYSENRIKKDKEKHTTKEIMWREFANYECQIVMSVEDALPTLLEYGYTKDEIDKEYSAYFAMCVEKDLF